LFYLFFQNRSYEFNIEKIEFLELFDIENYSNNISDTATSEIHGHERRESYFNKLMIDIEKTKSKLAKDILIIKK
jgi:hypothetical protein